jgi:diguanylate cyclase (GGDEF)-like protein/PAS domain S-box-containing protein
VVDNLVSGVVLQHADGAIRACNPSAERILGLTADQMIGRKSIDPRWQALREDGLPFPGQEHPAMLALTTGQPQHSVVMGIHKPDDTLTWILVSSQPMFRPGEAAPYAAVTSFEDITVQKIAENSLVEYLRQMDILRRADAELSDGLSMDYVLQIALDIAVRLSLADSAFIGLIQEDEGHIVQALGHYQENDHIDFQAGIVGRVLRQRHPAFVPDVDADPDYIPVIDSTCSQITLPLISHNHLLGVINLETRKPGRFTVEMFELLHLIGARVAVALENAQLYQTVQRQLAELRALHQQTAFQAEHDYLTGLPNRQLFEKRTAEALAKAEAGQCLAAVLYIDLDRFKIINDTLGHSAGDAVLCHVGHRLLRCAGPDETVARLGGDEFALLLPCLSDPQAAADRADMILKALRVPLVIEGSEVLVSASIGVSLYPQDGADLRNLLRHADHALYESKSSGRNTYHLYSGSQDADDDNPISLESALRRALDNQEVALHYQPQIDLRRDALVGMEALMRWAHPELGSVSPARFIPLAEESGLIIELGRWALREACQQCARWNATSQKPLRVSVNISGMQFRRDDFADTVAQALWDSGLDPACLELELTESLLMQTAQANIACLQALRSLGVRIAIDDFGISYSSLNYLQRLPIDTLKIDRSFIMAIGTETQQANNDAIIVRAITQLAHNLDMEVVAEGVETHRQAAFLRRIGCDMIQGFLYSPPLAPAEIEPLLHQMEPIMLEQAREGQAG